MNSVLNVNLKPDDEIKGFIVKKKLHEGTSGSIFLVSNQNNKKIKGAMKVEPFMESKNDEILKIEVFVLKKLQNSSHVCRLMASGKTDKFSFVVVSLLWKDLAELRRRIPGRKMSLPTTLKIGLQCLNAIQDLHNAGFIHRNIKPTNFACGYFDKHAIYIFDFGLVRQITYLDKNGKFNLREPKKRIFFHGTARYCSTNVHGSGDQGRQDDLVSFVFVLIELLTGTLPWKGKQKKEAIYLKNTISDEDLFRNCPNSFLEIFKNLQKLTYHDIPDYNFYRNVIKHDLKRTKVKM